MRFCDEIQEKSQLEFFLFFANLRVYFFFLCVCVCVCLIALAQATEVTSTIDCYDYNGCRRFTIQNNDNQRTHNLQINCHCDLQTIICPHLSLNATNKGCYYIL